MASEFLARGVKKGLHQMIEKDRRRYVRVEDKLYLKYRVIEKDEYERVKDEFFRGIFPCESSFSHPLLSKVTDKDIKEVERENPTLGKVLRILDIKLNLILNLLDPFKKIDFRKDEPKKVVISGSGISFWVDRSHKIKVGDYVELHIGIIPFLCVITCWAKVVRVEDGDFQKFIALDYDMMLEEDREKIIEYVFLKQRDILKLRRLRSKEGEL